MPLNLNSGLNIINATTAAPSQNAAYEKTIGSNETGIFVWANNSIEVHGYSNNQWSIAQALDTQTRFVALSWDDYDYVYFRGVNDNESIRVYSRISSGGPALKIVSSARVDTIASIPDVPDYTSADSGKLLTIGATGEIEFQLSPFSVAGTDLGDNIYPKIDSVSATILDASEGASRITIEGSGFLPTSKIYIFDGVPTAQQIDNLTGFETTMLNSIASDSDVTMDQPNTETVFMSEKIIVGWTEVNNEYGGVASYGFINPGKMVISLEPDGSQAGSTFSILVVNENGKKALYQNCFAVETMLLTSVSPVEIDVDTQSALQIIGENFDSNTQIYLYDGTESASDRTSLINYKSNAFTFQDTETFNTTSPLTFDVTGSNYTVIAAKGAFTYTLSNAFEVVVPPPWDYADTTIIPAANWNDTEHRVINIGSITSLIDFPINSSARPDGFRVMFRFGAVDGDWRYSNIAFTYADDATQFWRVQRTRPGTMYSAYYTGGSSATAADALLNQPGIYSHRYDTYPAALAVAPDGTVTFERVHEDQYGANQTFEVIYTFPTLVDVTNASAKQLRLTFAASNSSIGDLRISN